MTSDHVAGELGDGVSVQVLLLRRELVTDHEPGHGVQGVWGRVRRDDVEPAAIGPSGRR